MTTHTFTYSRQAYDACQCDESIHNGDTLVIENEGVVGLAGTWPIAVTVVNGALERLAVGVDMATVMADWHLTVEHIRHAVTTAEELGLKVREMFTKAADTCDGVTPHDWQEQPGEPPIDVCSSCGEVRE